MSSRAWRIAHDATSVGRHEAIAIAGRPGGPPDLGPAGDGSRSSRCARSAERRPLWLAHALADHRFEGHALDLVDQEPSAAAAGIRYVRGNLDDGLPQFGDHTHPALRWGLP
jgi:hypothetical protein